MSGVLRRGSLSFDVDNRSKRGSVESNLYGGYRDNKPTRTPEISVISFDFRRHSQDLKKDFNSQVNSSSKGADEQVPRNLSEDVDSDIISNYIGHYGKWNFTWTFILSLFQITPTFQMFAFVFQEKAVHQQSAYAENALLQPLSKMHPNAAEKQPFLDNDTIDVSQLSADEMECLQSQRLSKILDHGGLWQALWCFIISIFQGVSTFHIFTFVFQTADKDFWCARPESMQDMNTSMWQNLTQPLDSCSMLDVDYSAMDTPQTLIDYLVAPPHTLNYTSCSEYEFAEAGSGDMTLVQEFSLLCSRRKLLSVVEMCFLAGAAVGSVSSGWISDRFGRKHTLMGFACLQTIFGTLLAFSSSLAMYMALRVIIGFASMTVAVVSFVLVVELVSGKWRTIIGILNILPVAVTYVVTAGIAYFIRDWRTLQLAISLPWFAILTIWFCVPESPRWLLAKGRLDELYVIIERAARFNGITLPANYKKSLEAVVPPTTSQNNTAVVGPDEAPASINSTSSKDTQVDSNASPFVVVFGKDYWRTTCLTLVVWLTLIIIYFGLTLHLSNLGGNIYVNTAIAGSVEAVSICLSVFVVLKLGLRLNLIAYMLIPGVCCLATNIVPKGDENLIYVISLAMIAKCIIGANNAIIPTFTAMQYPTVVRNFGVGMGNLAAGVALILVPYMWLLEHIDPLLPMSIMGVCGLVGAIALTMMKDVHQ